MKTIFLFVRWLCALLAWCLFFFWWREAATPGWVSPRAVTLSLLSIAAVVSGAILYSSVWIFHNKRIAKKGNRGLVSFYKPPKFEADALGRRIKLLPFQSDSYDPVVVIHQSGKEKEYVVEKVAPLVKGANA
jgi:hypothetical protein